MKLSYRRAVKDEADMLIELYNQSFYTDYIKYGECPAYGKTTAQMQQSIELYPKDIILCDGIAIGVISVMHKGSGSYFLGCLCVIPAYQNKGIGSRAVAYFLQHHRDWKELSLVTPADKDANIYFYTQKCGFEIVGTEMDGNVRVVRLAMRRL